MATAKGIKLPVVITADGTQAQAGFTKLRNSMQGLERGFGKYLSRQASALTGMVTGFFTIDALFSGIQQLIAHGQEVNKRISQYSPDAIGAQARLEAAQIKQDVATATQMGPRAAAVTRQKEAAIPQIAVSEAATAELANRFNVGVSELQKQAGRLAVGDYSGFAETAVQRTKQYFGYGDEMMAREEQLQNLRNIAPMPLPNVPPEKQPEEVQRSQQAIELLTQQLQEMRTLTRQLKAN